MLFCPAINSQAFTHQEKHSWKPPVQPQHRGTGGQAVREQKKTPSQLCLSACSAPAFIKTEVEMESTFRADEAYGLYWVNKAPNRCTKFAGENAARTLGGNSSLCFNLPCHLGGVWEGPSFLVMDSTQMKLLVVSGQKSPALAVATGPHAAGLPGVPQELLPCSTRRWASASSQLHLGHGSSGTGSCLREEQMKGEG